VEKEQFQCGQSWSKCGEVRPKIRGRSIANERRCRTSKGEERRGGKTLHPQYKGARLGPTSTSRRPTQPSKKIFKRWGRRGWRAEQRGGGGVVVMVGGGTELPTDLPQHRNSFGLEGEEGVKVMHGVA